MKADLFQDGLFVAFVTALGVFIGWLIATALSALSTTVFNWYIFGVVSIIAASGLWFGFKAMAANDDKVCN